MKINKLIGVSGFARSGKDTFYERCALALNCFGVKSIRFSFADALKSEVDSLLMEHVGISAFTEKDSDKEIIRPLLVTYGTDIRRKLNPDCWIESISKKVEDYLSQGYFVFITDVRFLNEAEWVKSQSGYLFNINREGVGAANKDEKLQLKLFKHLIDYKVTWPTFGAEDLHSCDKVISPLFSKSSSVDFFPKNNSFINSKNQKMISA